MRKSILLIIIFLLACTTEFESNWHIRMGNIYINNFEYSKAYREYSKCLKIDSTNYVALTRRFISSLFSQNFDLAKMDLIKAQRYYYDSAGVYHNWGFFYDAQDSIDLAKEYYKKAISLDSNLSTSYSNLGVLYFKEKNTDLALIYQNKAISINEKERGSYVNRGELFHYLNRNDLALDDYNRAVYLSKTPYEKANSYNYRAMFFRDIKEYQKSIDDFNIVEKNSPPSGKLYYYRGLSYYAIRDYKSAIIDFQKANKFGIDTNEMIENCKELMKTYVK
jgi:tetratricopeptide (TPR) repeat protein